MLLLASFLTVHFGEWRESWHGTTGLAKVGESAFHAVRWENQGVLAALEPDTGECLWRLTLDTPAGFALDEDRIYINSMYGNRVSVLAPDLDTIDVLAKWFMNDLHSLTLTAHGLLITSSGVDAVVEIAASGDELWSWFATDRAYRRPGPRPSARHRRDFRRNPISTQHQATHCNSAVAHSFNGSEAVVIALFHQGDIIAVDRKSGRHRVLLSGMDKPHSVRKTSTGWVVSDSRNNCVVLLDHDFWISSVIDGDFDWVQDAIFHEGRLLVADANHSRLVWWDLEKNRPLREIRYSDQWKIYQVEIIEGPWEQRLRSVPTMSAATGERLLVGDGLAGDRGRNDRMLTGGL